MPSRLYLFIIIDHLTHFHTPHPSGKPLIFSLYLWGYFCFATFVHLFYCSHSTHKWNHTWTAVRQTSLSITNSRSLLKLMSIESVMPSNHLILCRPLLLLLSRIRVFSSESVLHIRWPKYWSFSFSISPSNEYSGLIDFL